METLILVILNGEDNYWRNIIDTSELEQILRDVKSGSIELEEAMKRLRILPFEDLGFAKVDHHRTLRKGFPEVIYGPGKSPDQIVDIARSLMAVSSTVLITRVEQEVFESVSQMLPEVKYHSLAKLMVIDRGIDRSPLSGIVIVAAGTSDLPVAEEASITAELMGNKVERIWDVGVAGLHRLLENLPILNKARVVVAVAGMEGALPSLVAGLVSAPVIAVPTSVGYGANFHGMAALLAMLNACSSGIAVVNIDNGFGAGYMAAIINLLGSNGSAG